MDLDTFIRQLVDVRINHGNKDVVIYVDSPNGIEDDEYLADIGLWTDIRGEALCLHTADEYKDGDYDININYNLNDV